MTDDARADLIEEWNAAGRSYMKRLNGLIADAYAGRETPKTWPEDGRTVEEARIILALAEAEDRAGRWRRDRPVADRAHEPFLPMLDDVCQNLQCVSILGPDEYLVRLGTAYQPGPALHLNGGAVRQLPGVLAVAMSRNHDFLLLVRETGFAVSRGLDADPVGHFPWPQGVSPTALDCLQLSDDGTVIAFVHDEIAVWLGQLDRSDGMWTRVYPNDAFLAERTAAADEEDAGGSGFHDSMMHCGLSPDGRFIAYGSQCYGHFIDRIDGIGVIRRWATIGHRSEYPHHACFSDDGSVAALNSCHFYNGETVGVRLADIEGAVTEAYEADDRVPLINPRLRVYAGTWLPLGPDGQGFALAGASYLDLVSPEGDIRSATLFGSTASSIDYCPRTGVVAVGSYSGFLHIYDPGRPAEDDRTIGYRSMHELYRWVLWRDRAPFRW